MKSLSFTRKLGLPVIGLVENMAGYACPCCGEISDTFGRGGGEDMAKRNGLGFLGRVPIDTVLVGLLDAASKGEIPAAGISGEAGKEEVPAEKEAEAPTEFPLLDRYLATTSSRVWKDIAIGVVKGIDARRDDIKVKLDQLSITPSSA